MFLILFRNILCPQQMFPSLRAQGNVMSNNVSATMCPRLPPPLVTAKVKFYSREKTFAGKKFLLTMHVHVLVTLVALFATLARARAGVVFTSSTFALLIFRRFPCFCNHFRHVF